MGLCSSWEILSAHICMDNTIVIQWPAGERIRVVTRIRITALPDTGPIWAHCFIFIWICRVLYAVVNFYDNVSVCELRQLQGVARKATDLYKIRCKLKYRGIYVVYHIHLTYRVIWLHACCLKLSDKNNKKQGKIYWFDSFIPTYGTPT